MAPLSLRLNFSWIAAGNAVGALSQFGLAVVLARVGNMQMVGTVGLAVAVCAPVYALAHLGLRGAVITDAKREYGFGEYLALRLSTTVLALVAVRAIVAAGDYDQRTAAVILLVALGESFKALSDIFHALLQRQERMDRIGISLMIQGPLMLALLALGVWLTGDVLWAMAGYPLAMAMVLFAYDLPNGARILRSAGSRDGCTVGEASSGTRETRCPDGLRPRWNAARLLRLAWLTLPLGAVLMLIALTSAIPRYMVNRHFGEHALGVFLSIVYVGMVGARVIVSMGQSAGPRLAKYYAAGNAAAYYRLLAKVLGLVLGLGAVVVAVVAVAGGPVLGWLYGEDYTPYLDLAVWLTAAAAVAYLTIPLGIAVEAMRRFKTHMLIRGVGVGVLLILIPRFAEAYGLTGVAAAMLVGSACSVGGCAAVIISAVRAGLAPHGESSAVRA